MVSAGVTGPLGPGQRSAAPVGSGVWSGVCSPAGSASGGAGTGRAPSRGAPLSAGRGPGPVMPASGAAFAWASGTAFPQALAAFPWAVAENRHSSALWPVPLWV